MTPRDAILARLGRSPATKSDLRASIAMLTQTPFDVINDTTASEISKLIASGDVEHLPAMGLYRLTTKQIPNNQPKE